MTTNSILLLALGSGPVSLNAIISDRDADRRAQWRAVSFCGNLRLHRDTRPAERGTFIAKATLMRPKRFQVVGFYSGH
jgi:hypothetical protein